MSRISAPRGSFGYAQDRLFDFAPSAVPRDKSVRRFAQDDDFVGGLKKNTPNRLTLVGRYLSQSSLRDFSMVHGNPRTASYMGYVQPFLRDSVLVMLVLQKS